MLSIGPIVPIKSKLALLKLNKEDFVGSTIADIGSGSSIFPEEVLNIGASDVYAVDTSYTNNFTDFINKANRTINFLTNHVKDNEMYGYVYGIPVEDLEHRIEIVSKSIDRVMSRKKIYNLDSTDQLLDNQLDYIFLSNMLLGVDDISEFISTLKKKLKSDGRIFITEYCQNSKKIDELTELGFAEEITQDDGLIYLKCT